MCTNCLPFLARPVDRRRLLVGLTTAAAAPALSGCERIASALVPSAEIERLGLEAWARLRARVPASTDGTAQRAARTIADRLLLADGDDPAAWEVLVFASPEINAFVLPGRKIGIFEGLVATAGSADELAAVIGHEIGHLTANHAEERVVASVAQDLGVRLVALALDWGDVPFGEEVAAAFGMGVEFGLARPYGRAQELEADRLGLFTMARAGYDPRAAILFWERMDRARPRRPAGAPVDAPGPGEAHRGAQGDRPRSAVRPPRRHRAARRFRPVRRRRRAGPGPRAGGGASGLARQSEGRASFAVTPWARGSGRGDNSAGTAHRRCPPPPGLRVAFVEANRSGPTAGPGTWRPRQDSNLRPSA